MPYPASDRGVVYTPILDGFFTQYGDVPLNLFDLEADALAPSADEVATEVAARRVPGDPDIATKQVMRVCCLKGLQRLPLWISRTRMRVCTCIPYPLLFSLALLVLKSAATR